MCIDSLLPDCYNDALNLRFVLHSSILNRSRDRCTDKNFQHEWNNGTHDGGQLSEVSAGSRRVKSRQSARNTAMFSLAKIVN